MTPDTAFNQGSDARLAGLPKHTNPHHGYAVHDREAWFRGWDHCDKFFGRDAKGWPVRRLPAVKR